MKGYISYNSLKHGKLIKIADYRYSVNKFGEVFSLFSAFNERKTVKKLKQFKTKNSYKKVTLYNDSGKRLEFLVHRLVAYVYLGLDLNSKFVVNHKNLNKLDNNLNNLQVITQKQNMKHFVKNRVKISGLQKAKELGLLK